MTVAAMAKALNVVIQVVATDTNSAGGITAWMHTFSDGVTSHDGKVIVVGYNKQTAHYTAFTSAHSVQNPRQVQSIVEECDVDELFESCMDFERDDESPDCPMELSYAGCTRSRPSSCCDNLMDVSVDDCLEPQRGSSMHFEKNQCANCMRCDTSAVPLCLLACKASYARRHISLVKRADLDETLVFCYDCRVYLQVGSKYPGKDLWAHSWPAAIAYLLRHDSYAAIRSRLWHFLPDVHRQSWQVLAGEMNLDTSDSMADAFKDVTSHLSRYEALTKSGVIADFLSAMKDYSFPCVKCPAGCFAYVDECNTVSFKHFIAWKFAVSIYGGNATQLNGAQNDWPMSSLQLGTFLVSPSVIINAQGLSVLVCKFHKNGLTKPLIHVPSNPVLGDIGFQSPDKTAASILTPNMIRAGRMSKWTNSSHVINAVGGYTGISSSSIAQRVDLTLINGKNPGFLQGCKSQCSHTSKTANIKSSYAPPYQTNVL
jgi:hypothetical protein